MATTNAQRNHTKRTALTNLAERNAGSGSPQHRGDVVAVRPFARMSHRFAVVLAAILLGICMSFAVPSTSYADTYGNTVHVASYQAIGGAIGSGGIANTGDALTYILPGLGVVVVAAAAIAIVAARRRRKDDEGEMVIPMGPGVKSAGGSGTEKAIRDLPSIDATDTASSKPTSGGPKHARK